MNETKYVLIGRIPIDADTRFALPEGYPREEATKALAALLWAEEDHQIIAKEIAASPLLSPKETHDL